MKVAFYHNLPPGGALRVVWEFVRRTCDINEYDMFTVDMGPADAFSYAGDLAEGRNFAPFVAREFRYKLFEGIAGRIPLGRLQPLEAVRRIRLVERDIADHINRGGYDVAYIQPCQLAQTPSLLRYLTVPSLYYMHEARRRSFEAGYWAPRALKGPLSVPRWAAATLMERTLRHRDILAVSSADRIACNSYYTAESIKRAYGRDADVCYLGIDEDTFCLSNVESRSNPREVMSVGGLERLKGHDLVVRALGLLSPKERPALNIVYERCDDDYRREIEQLARSLGVDVRLHRGISDSNLAHMYQSSPVTVLAARLEPFGLVALESLACGTPVVAIREAGYRETVNDGVNGYLVDRSATAIADAVRRVLRGELATSPEVIAATVLPRWGWSTSIKRQLEILAAAAEPSRP